jgi:hypothetical protein
MGIGIGLKKTMYMMAGELVGVFIISTLSPPILPRPQLVL